MLHLHNINLQVYAETEQEAHDLQQLLNNFITTKYQQGIYPRAKSLSNLIKRYGGNKLVDNFIR